MPRIALSLPDWQAVAKELAGAHNVTAPPGLLERVHALLDRVPGDWTSQVYELEVDTGGADAIHAAFSSLSGRDAAAGQRNASVAEAEQIIRSHQHRG